MDELDTAASPDHPTPLTNGRQWTQALRDVITQSNYVRVRSGGTCHRQTERENTLAEERGAKAIRELIDAIEIEDGDDKSICMCCGNPTIEFYMEDGLLAEVGLHHARSARWKGWPWDAMLTFTSRDLLAQWLFERGEHSFMQKYKESLATEALSEDILNILPEKTANFFRTGTIDELTLNNLGSGEADENRIIIRSLIHKSVLRRMEDGPLKPLPLILKMEITIPSERAWIAFRLLGCGEGSWDRIPSGGLHGIALELLQEIDPVTCGEALSRAFSDRNGKEGAVRWLLCNNGLSRIPEAVRSEIIEKTFRYALSHARKFNRSHALALLAQRNDPFVTPILNDFMNTLPVRSVDPRFKTEFDSNSLMLCENAPITIPNNISEEEFACKLMRDRENNP